MYKITGTVNKADTLDQYEGLPVHYNHFYAKGALGYIRDGLIELDDFKPPFEKMADIIREGKVYAVTGGFMENGKERVMEVSLTLFPMPEYKGTPVRIVEDEDAIH